MANHHAMLARQFVELQHEYAAAHIKLAAMSCELAVALEELPSTGTYTLTFTYPPPHETRALEDAYINLLGRLHIANQSVARMQDKLDIALGLVPIDVSLAADAGLDARIAQATNMAC